MGVHRCPHCSGRLGGQVGSWVLRTRQDKPLVPEFLGLVPCLELGDGGAPGL